MRYLLLCLGLGLAAVSIPVLRSEPTAADKPFGIDTRVPFASSKVVGSPEPPHPYRTIPAFAKLKFANPTDLAISPLDDAWLMTEQHGTIRRFANSPDATETTPFLDIRGKNKQHDGRQIWSSTFHPKYAENGWIYVAYHDTTPKPPRCRVVRYTAKPIDGKTAMVCDPASEFIVVEWQAGEDHWGGCLKFGPDGCLYFSAGDGSSYADGFQTGQDISDLNASILRIDVDRSDLLRPYTIPKDNPFVDLKGARGEVWAYGLRNVWKMSFDRKDGHLWAGDVGQDLWEMIHRIEKGGNCGWSVTEGTHGFRPERKVGPSPILKPVVELEHSEARSVTGGFVYRGKKHPGLYGQYIYADFETGKIWGLNYDGKTVTNHRELDDTPLKIVAFAEDNRGELYVVSYTGTIHQLDPAPTVEKPVAAFPRRLSETGLFTSTKDGAVAPGVIPYEPNSQLWSDGSHKERWMAIPGDGKIGIDGGENWRFPEGTILIKTFALELVQGKPESRRRLETRIMHLEQDHWRGYTYIWNDEQTDADLNSKAAVERTFDIADPSQPSGIRRQTWHFPSRAECTLCHTMPVQYVLGLSTPQLNREMNYGKVRDNQMRTLEHIGMFREPLAKRYSEFKGDFVKLPKMTDPTDATEPLDLRARAYLHTNCSVCHRRWGGGNALFEVQWGLKTDQMKILNVPPGHGSFGVADACIVKPGDPDKSLLYTRMIRTDGGRMPKAGSSVIDAAGSKLIRDWIGGMK